VEPTEVSASLLVGRQGAAGEGKMALVYELMEGGSLLQQLVEPPGGTGLTLPQRSVPVVVPAAWASSDGWRVTTS
jgi:hypothetical protein